jgi:ABC-type multidrug transport system fused ATPase/permease subunit
MIDGVDVRDITLKSLRRLIGIVSQDVFLFSGTVRSNILYGDEDKSEQQMLEAARIAHADVFIKDLPEGFDTVVGERGVRLSGGQKQRIAIARALLRNPPFLILDEATSALDTESETLVHDAISQVMKGRTSLVIAHRLSTIQNADRVVVLDAGRVVQAGRREELEGQDGLFRRLAMAAGTTGIIRTVSQ